MTNKIEGTVEAWDERHLGASEEYVRKSTVKPKDLDDSLELQMISIRLQKSLLDKLKLIAVKNGLGYQPLMKQVLTRFADAEIKRIVGELVDESTAVSGNEKLEESTDTNVAA